MKLKYSFFAPVLALMIYSCGNGPDYTNVIPKNSATVVSFDLNEMSSKARLCGDEADVVSLERLENMMKSGLPGSEDLVTKIFDDISECGLELENNRLYLFAAEHANCGGIIAKVTDKGKLENIIEALYKQNVCQKVQETDGCKWTIVGQWLLAYSKSALVLVADNKGVSPESLVHQASMWLRQKDGEGFASSDDFKLMQEKDADIVAWTTLGLLPREAVYPLTMGISAELKLNDVKAISTVNFESGKTIVDVEPVISDKIMNEMMSRKDNVTQPVKGTFLDKFPAKTDFWATANLKGGDFFNFICENPTISRIFRSSLIPLDFNSIFSAIEGDVVMSMDNSGKDFIVMAQINTEDFMTSFEKLKTMAAMSGGQVVFKDHGERGYLFRTHDGSLVGLNKGPVALWLGVKDGLFYLTNKESLIDRKVLGLSLRDKEWGNRVEGQKFFMETDISSLNKLIDLSHLNGTMASVLAFLGGLDYLTVESPDGKNIHIEVIMKDKNTNPLTMLISNN